MPLSKEQLMIPRVLCIGGKEGEPNDTSGKWISGRIIELTENWPNCQNPFYLVPGYDIKYFNQYPHLFKPLPWWYGRRVEEMPQYVKDENFEVWKVTKYFIDSSVACFYTGEIEKKGWLKGTETPFNLLAVEPADLTDYMEYQKQNDA